MLPKSAMQESHCGEATPVLAVPVVSASGSEKRASGGLPNPQGLLPRGDAKSDSAALASLRASGVSPSRASGVETTGV